MSSAFDTIDRQTLLEILREIVEEDELRIIRFLLSDTIINTRINGATKEKPFESNIGSPQEDSLSPVLFSIYLENALKEVRTILPRPTSDFEKTLPTESVYADDVDFTSQCRQDRTNNTVKIRQRIQERKESRHTDRRRRRHQ